MSSQHTAEFKAKVASEALSNKSGDYTEVASKYDVSEENVKTWVSEFQNSTTNANNSETGEVTDVALESDNAAFIHAVNFGAEEEGLDMASIYKWSGLGVVAVVIFIVSLIFYSQFAVNNAMQNANVTSSYYEIEQLTEDADERLSSFGIIDLENGVYHIPIDEAINKIAVD